MRKNSFKPQHLSATENDFEGNQSIGRYVLLPGSDGRAKEIASYFTDLEIREHARGHHLYLGNISNQKQIIQVAAISTGMGCASTEIILHELFQLGCKRFLRIGTAGALQSFIKTGDLINVHASVRDDGTTENYLPPEFPAVASLEFNSAILFAAEQLHLSEQLHTGIVHCKGSLYAREFGAGPKKEDNENYLELLKKAGVFATEMETATLFIQTQLYNAELFRSDHAPEHRALAGAILAILGPEGVFETSAKTDNAITHSIELGLTAIKTLARQELSS